ncbi:MAG: type II secretion system protein [Firmicutes bacterium]|nr:type II secretion system protein [Bacillota bacterium]
MKRNQRGFTIVELVIVIAVIAILAAVLIPTFTSLINKANISADQQAVRQMNTALAIDEAENGRAETVEQALDVLNKAGYKANEYIALADGYQFYWDQSTNRVVLYNNNGNKIEYPEDAAEKYKDYKDEFSLNFKTLNINEYVTLDKTPSGSPIDSAEALKEVLKSAATFQTVKIAGDISMTAAEFQANYSETKSTNIDLNEKTLSLTGNSLQIVDDNKVTLTNGSVNGSLSVSGAGRLSLDQVEVTGLSGNYGVWIGGEAAEINIKDSVIIGDVYGITTNAGTAANYGVNGTISGTVIKTEETESDDNTAILLNVRGSLSFENCDIEGGRQAVVCRAGTATFRNCRINGRGWIPDSSNTSEYPYSQEQNAWGDGNRVATAAITMGAKQAAGSSTGGYIGDAVINLYNCTVTSENGVPLVYLAGTGKLSTATRLNWSGGTQLTVGENLRYFRFLTVEKGTVVCKAGDILVNGTAINADAQNWAAA